MKDMVTLRFSDVTSTNCCENRHLLTFRPSHDPEERRCPVIASSILSYTVSRQKRKLVCINIVFVHMYCNGWKLSCKDFSAIPFFMQIFGFAEPKCTGSK